MGVTTVEAGGLDLIRAAQVAYHSGCADAFGQQLVEGGQQIRDWSYRPPVDDDPETWRGVARWCYADYAYRFHIEREVRLAAGHGPYYCPIHEAEPQPLEGWSALGCFACLWEQQGYDATLAAARDIGRHYISSGQKARQAVAS